MIKIKLSEDYSYNDVLELCVEGITGNTQLRKQVSDERANFLPFKDEYEKAATKSQLFSIPSIDTSTTQNPNVIGPLKKMILRSSTLSILQIKISQPGRCMMQLKIQPKKVVHFVVG